MDLLYLVLIIFVFLATLVCLAIIFFYRWKQTIIKEIRSNRINQDKSTIECRMIRANIAEHIEISSNSSIPNLLQNVLPGEQQITTQLEDCPPITPSSSGQPNQILTANLEHLIHEQNNHDHLIPNAQYNYVEANTVKKDCIGSNIAPDTLNLQTDLIPQGYLPMICDKEIIHPNSSGFFKDYSKFVDPSLIIAKSDLDIGNKIGSGQFGTVRGGQLSMTKGKLTMKLNVAIKAPNDISAKKEIKSLLQEAIKMKNFDNKNVLSLIGVSFESYGTPLVVLPFMANGDLLAYLRDRNNKSTVKQLLNFVVEVAKGMEYLSKHGFIHRDLAARNIMLDNDLSVKVADFGLARVLNTSPYYHSKLGGKLPIRWMSIESLEQNKYSTKSDVWSYGVLAWEIFSLGVTPYTGLNNCDVLAHLKSRQRLPRPFLCAEEVYNTLLLCWSVNSKNRPSFSKLKENFENVILQGKFEDLETPPDREYEYSWFDCVDTSQAVPMTQNLVTIK